MLCEKGPNGSMKFGSDPFPINTTRQLRVSHSELIAQLTQNLSLLRNQLQEGDPDAHNQIELAASNLSLPKDKREKDQVGFSVVNSLRERVGYYPLDDLIREWKAQQ